MAGKVQIITLIAALFLMITASASGQSHGAEKPEHERESFSKHRHEEDERYVTERLAACEPEVTRACFDVLMYPPVTRTEKFS